MKKNLRSLLCALLALVLVCSCAGAAFAKDNGATPVISVHGMGGSGLYLNPGTEDEQQVGVFDAKSLLSRGGLIQNVLAAVGGKQTDPNAVIDQIADLMNDTRTLHAAQSEAAAMLAEDPLLEAPEHALLEQQVQQMFEKAGAMN